MIHVRRNRLVRALALALVWLLTPGSAAWAADPPEPPPGGAVDGDVVAGAEPPGLNASEWEAAMVGSSTAATGRGAVQAILENPKTDLLAFYKNLNGSLAADEDDAYHVFARRCGVRATRTEDCDPADVVYDHLVFTRTATPDGGYAYDVVSLTAESPVGVDAGVPGVSPFGDPSGPGPVGLPAAADPRRDPGALATLAEEEAAGTRSIDETSDTTVQVVRHFAPPERVTYPYPYERLAAELDDTDSADILLNPIPSGASPRGTHGALDVTQSRATLIVSGRGARRTPLDPVDELMMEIKHVDLAPTVAKVLGIPEHVAGQYLNNGTAAENPAAGPALLRRQDGKPLDGLLEPRINTFVVVVDGMIPEKVTATGTPNLCNLIGCPAAVAPDPSARSTVYEEARSVMITQTNANHTAMLTGAYGDVNGIVANVYYNRATPAVQDLEIPSLIRVDTLFDVLRNEAPHLTTAAVMGKVKLRELFDCTNDGNTCIADDPNNPEGEPVTHVRPDFLRGASDAAAPGSTDCQAEPLAGIAADSCIMDEVIRLSAVEDPDFTFVNLGNVDGLQHVSGPNSPIGDGAVTSADQQIGRLVDYLKESGKWERSVIIVTADHSFSWQGPLPTQRLNIEGLFAADPTVLATGEGFVVVDNGGAAQVYLTDVGVGTTSLPVGGTEEQALTRMREIALATTGVSEAWYRFENSLDPGQTLAANRPDWHLDDQRAGDLIVTSLASGPTAGPSEPLGAGGNPFEVAQGTGFVLGDPAGPEGALQGQHGHPGARHVPFIVLGGADHVVDQTIAATGTVNEGDDTAANPGQAEVVDVAPTVAWIYGLDPATAMPAASGRALTEAFSGRPIDVVEPHANRAVIFIFDGNNSVRIHDLTADCDDTTCGNALNVAVPAVRDLLVRDGDGRSDVPQGLLASFGSMASFPTVTFPNHNVIGSGVHPGHHGIVGNSYYERDIETERDPIDPTDPRNPSFFFSSALLRLDFETLHEAVHRAFGDWAPSAEDPTCDPAVEICNGPSGAFTASVNEPSARGADFASLETTSSENLPVSFAFLTANVQEFQDDTTDECANASPDSYGLESVLDHLGQAQARQLYAEPTIGPSGVPGSAPMVIDETGGASHPDPKYMINNYTLTDGSGHEFGPHGKCTRSGYRDTSSRFGRVLAELENHDRFDTEGEPARLGETFIVLTGDHGMENQNLALGPDHGAQLADADIEYVQQSDLLYLLTMRVDLLDADPEGFIPPGTQTLTFRVTDDDRDPAGAARPVAGAIVAVTNGPEMQSDLTDANGEVTFTFALPVSGVVLRADKDAQPTQGTRTVGSTSPDPGQHGVVTKTDFNETTIVFATPPLSTCATVPRAGCRQPAVPGKSLLLVKDKLPDTRDRLLFKWNKGSATTKADFGDPLGESGYRLCIYDGDQTLLATTVAPPGGLCGVKRPRPCWRERRKGFVYSDRDLDPEGLQKLVFKEGLDGKAKVILKGKGVLLDLPRLPVQRLPLTVQLQGLTTCFEATFTTTFRNQTDLLKAKSD